MGGCRLQMLVTAEPAVINHTAMSGGKQSLVFFQTAWANGEARL